MAAPATGGASLLSGLDVVESEVISSGDSGDSNGESGSYSGPGSSMSNSGSLVSGSTLSGDSTNYDAAGLPSAAIASPPTTFDDFAVDVPSAAPAPQADFSGFNDNK